MLCGLFNVGSRTHRRKAFAAIKSSTVLGVGVRLSRHAEACRYIDVRRESIWRLDYGIPAIVGLASLTPAPFSNVTLGGTGWRVEKSVGRNENPVLSRNVREQRIFIYP